MYGAGKLESRNVKEYEVAARHAWACDRREWVDCLLTMAEVEWEHEAFFSRPRAGAPMRRSASHLAGSAAQGDYSSLLRSRRGHRGRAAGNLLMQVTILGPQVLLRRR
jgi:hypothetical protein